MNLPTRGAGLGFLPVIALCLTVLACSGQDANREDLQQSSSPSADPATQDEKAIEGLYAKFWKIRIESENSATIDEDTYAGVLEGPDLERQGLKMDRYQKRDLVRSGHPIISNVEVSVAGDTAHILACQSEHDWRAKVDGKLIPRPKVLGNVGTGDTAERHDGDWILTELTEGDDSRCS